jgi:dTDP-4-amino-4,6-dideoxygalactose transaminase
MDKIMELADKYNLLVIEDAAQAIDSFYTGRDGIKRALGSIGHLAAFSFHETKNIISGEGGMLTINHERFVHRAEIIWEKGTNRAEFFRGEVNKYGWVDTGSSFLPSEVIAAFLWAQIENIPVIQAKRKHLWECYYLGLKDSQTVKIPIIPDFATNNGHMFYILANNLEERDRVIHSLKKNGYHAVFHYISLHSSPYYFEKHDHRELVNSDNFTDCLLRLPMFFELEESDVLEICKIIG